MKRRDFIKNMGFAILGQSALSTLPILIPQQAHAATGKNVIKVFLRGGMDALSFLVPRDYQQHQIYMQNRPGIGLQRSQLINLQTTAMMGLHPSATNIANLMNSREAILFQGAGSKAATRSHFTQMAHIECGNSDSLLDDGYFYRALGTNAKKLEMVSLGATLAHSMNGTATKAASMTGTYDYAKVRWLDSHRSRTSKQDRVWGMARSSMNDCTGSLDGRRIEFCKLAEQAKSSMNHMEQALNQMQTLSDPSVYGQNSIGHRIREAVKLVSNPSLNSRIVNIDFSGWDHHKNQGVLGGVFSKLIGQLDQAIMAAKNDLERFSQWNDTVIIVMSEFGRSLPQNGAQGTDHGRGGAMMVFGGNLRNGGRIVAPGFDLNNLDLRDLRVTVDYREIMAEIMQKHLGISVANIQQAFPGFTYNKNYGLLG